MHIFADESGNTGKEIFNKPAQYHAGAVFVLDDVEEVLRSVIQPVLDREGLDRMHASKMPTSMAVEVGCQLIEALDNSTTWTLFLVEIDKSYIATTKFVDTVFDHAENVGARAIWYNHEYFRHAICCAVDDMLTPKNRHLFWESFIENDGERFKEAVRNARTYLGRVVEDRRLHEVIFDALEFAIRYPEEITLGGQRRTDYRGHTPNLIAFSVLMGAAHKFADQHGATPETFIHDEQQEFGRAMADAYNIFSPFRWKETDWMALPERARANLGTFKTVSSRSLFSLQAVDTLLWLARRQPDQSLAVVQELIAGRTMDKHHLSRACSEMICVGWQAKIARMPLSTETRGRRILSDYEQGFRERRREFVRSK